MDGNGAADDDLPDGASADDVNMKADVESLASNDFKRGKRFAKLYAVLTSAAVSV
jgi:hypothetical protein